jgi:nucleoside-diphosphate-sugar epimerase
VRKLLAKGHQVRLLDVAKVAANLESAEPGSSAQVDWRLGDIVDRSLVREVIRDCDAVIHLAGVLTRACRQDPVRAAEVNLVGGVNVLQSALDCGVRRIAYASTAGVYGPNDGLNPRPTTHYGALKLAVEGCARAYWQDNQLPSVGFRPYVIYGAGVGSGVSAGPSVACRAAHQGAPATIEFSGRVGMVYVEDVAAAFVAAIESEISGASAWNLVGEVTSVDDFVSELRRQVPGADIAVKGAPMPIASDLDVSGEPEFLRALPSTGVRKGIERTLAHLARQSGAPTRENAGRVAART